jgi:hypothetical protein
MLNPEGISGCEDTPENVAERELVMQNPPSETIEDRRFHADNLNFTNWQDQKIDEITQVLDPGVDESNDCVVTYTADEIPGVEVTADVNEDESNECVVTYSSDEVEVTAVIGSENSSVTYPIVEIPGVDVELDVEVTGENKYLDAKSTGVEVDTGAYSSEAYDAVPQDQGNKTKVYGLGQQVSTRAQSKEGKKLMKHKTAMA